MNDRIQALTEILPFVREFQGGLFVLKLGGEVAQGQSLAQIAEQVSLIHHVGVKLALVHGGGPQINALLGQLGIPVTQVGGRRITDADTLRAAKMVYNGLINTDVVAALRAHGASAVGLTGVDGGLILATRRPPQPMMNNGVEVTVDFGHVGDIVRIQPELVETLMRERHIPVVCSLAADANGDVLNINADTIAAALAVGLKAQKLIVMTNVPGVLRRRDDLASIISYTDVETLRGMIRDGVIQGGMLPKVEACIDAILGGVPRTHVIDGGRPDALLLELFSNQGCGTMIVNESERKQYEDEMAEG